MRLYFKARHIKVYAPLDLDYARLFLTCATLHSFLGTFLAFCLSFDMDLTRAYMYLLMISRPWINPKCYDQI